jgi:hypothetical protein
MIDWALDALRHDLFGWLLVVGFVIVAVAVVSLSFSKRRK